MIPSSIDERAGCSGPEPLARSVTVTTWKVQRLEQKRIRARFGLTQHTIMREMGTHVTITVTHEKTGKACDINAQLVPIIGAGRLFCHISPYPEDHTRTAILLPPIPQLLDIAIYSSLYSVP